MKKFFAFAALAAVLTGCKPDESPTPAPDPNAIPKDNARLVLTLPTNGIQGTDKFVLAGNFKTNFWSPATSTYFLAKQEDGTYRVDVPVSAFPDGQDLQYKVVRNPTATSDVWKYIEKDATCSEIATPRVLRRADANKAITVKIDNFRNTGTCGD